MSGGGTVFSTPSTSESSTGGSGGPLSGRRCRYMDDPVDVGPEPTVPVALALDELYEALLLEQMQVALYGPGASGEPSSEGLHARPAQAGLVVRVIGEGAVGGDHLRGHPRQDQVVYLGYTGKPRTHRHNQPP